nr:hypothetical protein [Tanacetum cinerariifolium]
INCMCIAAFRAIQSCIGLHSDCSGIGHWRQSAFDRLSDTYSPSTTKSRPQRTDSRDSPRGRGHTRTVSPPRDDRHKIGNASMAPENRMEILFPTFTVTKAIIAI